MNLIEKISKNRNTLMGIAALMIVAFHIFPAKWEFVKTLYVGVDVFVLLMGFSFAYKMKKSPINSWNDYFKYVKDRFIRLYLPFVIAFGFEVLINYLFLNKFNFKPEVLLLYGTLKKSLYYWYVIYAIGMTFILPLFYFFYKKAKNKTIFTFLICLLVFGIGKFLPYPLLMGRIWTCLFGIYLYDARDHFITSSGLLFLPIAFLTYFIITKNILRGFELYSFGGIFAICFVGWYAMLFNNLKLLDIIGKYSYEIYLTLTWLSSIIFRINIENKMFWIIFLTMILVVLEKSIYELILKIPDKFRKNNIL